MGTNFYIRGYANRDEEDSIDHHIGKRSAAGLWCWDCNITMCKGGVANLHAGFGAWHEKCPQCGQSKSEEALENSSAGRELGFNKSKPQKKTGIKSCCSFTWGIAGSFEKLTSLIKVRGSRECQSCHREYDDPEKCIENEYGDLFTLGEFKEVLSECPNQKELMGVVFF